MLRLDEDALGDSDLVHAEAHARPAAYILQAKLSNPFFRFSPADFTGWFCFQFRIPQAAPWQRKCGGLGAVPRQLPAARY